MSFSATEAAFEGFRVTRHHPVAVLAWALVALISLFAMYLMVAPILSPIAGEFQAVMASGGKLQPSLALQTQLSYAALATVPVSMVAQAILMPAVYRAMTNTGRDRFGFLRLGREELRTLGALAIVTIVSLIVNQAGESLAALALASGIGAVALLIQVAAMIAGIYLSVRLVFVVPAAFAEGRIDLKAGWQATAGLFWSLLGMAIIAGFMACIVMLLLGIVALPISVGVVSGGGATPASLVALGGLMLLMALAVALSMTVLAAPFMTAYRAAKGLTHI
ncbi:MAG TPA: hypothetical protein VF633_12470 [Brevundimonas sp.]|jgi:hypothetical protein